jgi:hypothetical protein
MKFQLATSPNRERTAANRRPACPNRHEIERGPTKNVDIAHSRQTAF